jgi:hypothetical protein
MKLASVALCSALLLCACETVNPSPSVPTPGTVAIDCGPYASDFADCLAIVAAAAKAVDPSPDPGSRVDVSKGLTGDGCIIGGDCEQAAAASVAHVTFVSPTGSRASADVITSPLGAYVGVNPVVGR